MTGFSGVINDPDQDIEELSENLFWLGSERKFDYRDEKLKISASLHDISEDEPPAEADDGDVLIWVWGEIYGHDDGKDYTAKHKEYPQLSDSEYCAKLYEKYGIEFVEGLNSNFAGVVYERDENIITLFTDRLSARPIFYARPSEDSLVFSTALQSIANHHSHQLEFDRYGLYDFFKAGRVYGLKTVLNNVKQIHPGSIFKFDLDSGSYSNEIYWQPKHTPKNWSIEKCIDKFHDILKKVISEQTAEDLDYGLMLSGGSDSRLIATLSPKTTTCYHMNEEMNNEAKTAKSVANELNLEFKFLERKDDYYFRVLEDTSKISNLNNWFEQGHAMGFIKNLRRYSNCILTGHYGDTILGHYIPTINLNFYFLSNTQKLIKKKYNDLVEFEKYGKHTRLSSVPKYIDLNSVSKRLSEKLDSEYNTVKFHDVTYPSLDDFQRGSWYYYPLTNSHTFLFYHSLNQILEVKNPYLDNRIIDISLKIPSKYLLRRDVINQTLSKYNPNIAKISHASTGLSLHCPKWIHLVFKDFSNFQKSLGSSEEKSKSSSGSWANYNEIMRNSDFVENKLKENSEILEKCDFISKELVLRIYKEHNDGKNNYTKISPLLTFLENPIIQKYYSSFKNKSY